MLERSKLDASRWLLRSWENKVSRLSGRSRGGHSYKIEEEGEEKVLRVSVSPKKFLRRPRYFSVTTYDMNPVEGAHPESFLFTNLSTASMPKPLFLLPLIELKTRDELARTGVATKVPDSRYAFSEQVDLRNIGATQEALKVGAMTPTAEDFKNSLRLLRKAKRRNRIDHRTDTTLKERITARIKKRNN